MSVLTRKSAPAVVRFFCSLELTITCLALGMLLIFLGTLAQVHVGTHQVQEWFFHSWVAWWPLEEGRARVPVMPGGYVIGGVLLLNLIAAFVYRYDWTARKAGLLVSHFGLIVLLVGELGTALYQRDSTMWLGEGETKDYAESFRTLELAVIERTDPQTDKVLAIHEKALNAGREIGGDTPFPFRLVVHRYFANTEVVPEGEGRMVREAPRTAKDNERDRSMAWIEVIGPNGSLGTRVIDAFANRPETFTIDGRTFTMELRLRRYYQPFSLTLLEFSHDRYPGTEIARNFSSLVRLDHPAQRENRETLIYMNHPLRHAGLTFYQESYQGEDRSMLRVVRNPSRHLPYIACGLVFLGLTIHFGLNLRRFLDRRKATQKFNH